MVNEPTNPKVVSGGDVVFEDGTSQADSLDGVVQAAVGAGSVSVPASWERENMVHLAEELVNIIGRSFSPPAKGVLPYILQGKLQTTTQSSGTALTVARVTTIEEVRAGILRPFLDAEFGMELAQSGIYEATGLNDDTNNVQLATLIPYFPEFNEVMELNSTALDIKRNPYQPLLAFPTEARPFFTGAIREVGYTADNASLTNWHLPVTLKDVMAYAKKVNQLPKVKEYMDVLNQVKKQQ